MRALTAKAAIHAVTGVHPVYDEEEHVYRVDGVAWPSVTTICKPVESDFSMIPPAILKKAADSGKAVHAGVEAAIKGTQYHIHLWSEKAIAAAKAKISYWHQFVSMMNCEVIESECRIVHPLLQYCGTLDLVLRFPTDPKDWLVDIKAGAVPASVGPQTAGYAMAYGQKHDRPLARAALQLTVKGFNWLPLTDTNDPNVFNSCLNIYRFNQKVGKTP